MSEEAIVRFQIKDVLFEFTEERTKQIVKEQREKAEAGDEVAALMMFISDQAIGKLNSTTAITQTLMEAHVDSVRHSTELLQQLQKEVNSEELSAEEKVTKLTKLIEENITTELDKFEIELISTMMANL